MRRLVLALAVRRSLLGRLASASSVCCTASTNGASFVGTCGRLHFGASDLLVEVPERGNVRAIEVLLSVGPDLEHRMERLVRVVDVVLRKNAHAQLVEMRLAQRLQRLRVHRQRLVRPCAAGRAERQEGRSIGVREVERVVHAHRPVHALRGAVQLNETDRPSSRPMWDVVR